MHTPADIEFRVRGSERSRSGTLFSVPAVIAVTVFLGAYLGIPLRLGSSLYVPFAPVVLLVPLLLFYVRNQIRKTDIIFLLQVLTILSASAFFSAGGAFLGEKLLGIAQTMVSLTAGVLFYKILERLSAEQIARISGWFMVVLLAGTALEVIGLLREVSDSFREAVFGGTEWGVYDAWQRDELIAGFARPKLFSSEPSVLAAFFLVVANIHVIASVRSRAVMYVLLASIAMFMLNGSPTILLSILVTAYLAIGERYKRTLLALTAPLLVAVAFGFLYFDTTAFSSIAARFNWAVLEEIKKGYFPETSVAVRLVYPYITAMETIAVSPLFGVGISGKEVIEGFTSFPTGLDPFGNNNFAALIIYLGLLGAPLFVYALFRYMRRQVGGTVWFLFGVLFLLSQAMGAFEGARFWIYVFAFLGAMRCRCVLEGRKLPAAYRTTMPGGAPAPGTD